MIKRFSPTAVGGWSTCRPVLAIAAWLTFVLIAVLALAPTGSKPLHSGAVGESARGDAMMKTHQLGFAPREYAYLHSDPLTARAPAFRAATVTVTGVMRRALGERASVSVSRDQHAALITVVPSKPFDPAAVKASVARAGRAHPGVSAVLADPGAGSGNDLSRTERLSIPVTLIVLLISFGALVAAAVPVLLAVTAVIAAFGLLGPISQLFPLDDSVKTVVLLIGMAVGVDYALFYVVRSREERARGGSTRAALDRTSRTSGRAVLIAGTTGMIAMAGQFPVGSDIFNGIASGTIVVVACAVVGSVTVLPALLELLGPRIDRGRIPFLPHLRTDGQSRFWSGLVERVLCQPVRAACLAGGLLVALAVPALGMHVAKPSSDALSAAGQSSLAAQVTSEFPGTSAPAFLVAFRSVVVPLVAITLNLLSVGAAYGVLVLVFQHRWAEGLLGFHSDGAIISWLPLFLFVVLFGLSMDYHVFILSRVREGVDRGMSTDAALRHGIGRTAGVVSAAALVMVGVFSLFGTAGALDLKEAGVGLAVAVLLDATVVRGVLLPATMKLLGERNWYLPRRLAWLPRAKLEASLLSPAAVGGVPEGQVLQ